MDKEAYQNVVRKLDCQRSDLAVIRNQASISAAFTGLIGTLFATLSDAAASKILTANPIFLGFSIEGALLLLFLSGSMVCAALALINRDEFTFSFNSEVMLSLRQKLGNEEEVFRQLAVDGEWYFMDNEKRIEKAHSMLWWSMVLGAVQIVPWILILLGSSNG